MTPTLARTELEELRQAIVRRIAPVLLAAGLDDHEVRCDLQGSSADLRVVLSGPELAASVTQALGVRVLDAVHADGHTFGTVEVVRRFGTTDVRR